MVYEQRSPAPPLDATPTERLWSPHELADVDVRAEDHYVSVDEVVNDVFRFTYCTWPSIDAEGRLRFPEDIRTTQLASDEARGLVDEHRQRHGQMARPLRLGDAFWVRRFDPDGRLWRDLIDVTASARDAAKVAVFGVVSGVIEAGVAERMGLAKKAEASTQREEPPPLGPIASSVI